MTREWRVLNDEGLCLFKNIACFHYKEHIVALTVNNTSIQLQVFRNITVKKVLTLEVRGIIERLLDELTGRIHTKLMYTVGYQCSMNDVLREYDDCFVAEKEIHRKGEINCPRHELTHTLSEPYLVGYWKKDCNVPETEVANTHKDSFIHCYEEALLKFHFQKFEKLTKVGRKALQIYFDTVFPTQDLANMSSRKNKVKKAFHLNDDQFARLFPADESIPCSESFDVTLMYQMLRNRFPSLPQPAKGWGKTPDTCDKSETDDVERIRIYRNQAVHEPDATSKLEKKDLEEKGRDLMQAIARLSKGVLRQEMMNALKNST
ncbi:uncharacterized protein LOC133186279 [Saccostrea echinata]|uniref:uncharacterized protein LOC133186279 n=1 Tax=Saccostrea echinata TaxID=191078 RepID=UPI002A7FBE10|nr:uncharacterized protein LOC133186279 [Saccostrea echinata]